MSEGEDFSGRDFSHADLAEREFVDCDFSGCNFRAADLRYARFERCQFNDASAEAPADFSQAELREATFERCNLAVVDMVRTKSYGITFSNCQLQGADLSKSDFRMPIAGSELAACTLENCNASYINLSHNYLVGCTLTGTKLLEACLDYVDLSDADLRECELHNASGTGLVIRGADLRGATFNTLDPRHIDLTGVRLTVDQLHAVLEPLGLVIESD